MNKKVRIGYDEHGNPYDVEAEFQTLHDKITLLERENAELKRPLQTEKPIEKPRKVVSSK